VSRIKQGFAALQTQLEAAKPDAVFIIGDDQNELFSKAMIPAFAMFIGEEAEGTYSIGFIGEKPQDNWIRLPGHPAIAKIALDGLVARGFDFGFAEKLVPLARPELGLGHAFTRIGHAMRLVETGIPAIPIFTNAYHPPMPSAARCYAMGQALRDIFANRPERIAIYGSGGLSHDPRGPRAGWVDEPLDRWVLERIERGESDQLKNLFTTDSATLRSGTGEIRNWIAVAGAYDGVKGTIVDYIPAAHAVTGLGFAYWTEAA
jgi:protocatechuate 4,5-dioxygenase beta chain